MYKLRRSIGMNSVVLSENGRNKADKVIGREKPPASLQPANPILRETMLKGRNECREKNV